MRLLETFNAPKTFPEKSGGGAFTHLVNHIKLEDRECVVSVRQRRTSGRLGETGDLCGLAPPYTTESVRNVIACREGGDQSSAGCVGSRREGDHAPLSPLFCCHVKRRPMRRGSGKAQHPSVSYQNIKVVWLYYLLFKSWLLTLILQVNSQVKAAVPLIKVNGNTRQRFEINTKKSENI